MWDLERVWRHSLDQKLVREPIGLVSFIGDGSRLSRHHTRHRSFFRTAGRKKGVNIPFSCPVELGPVEIAPPTTRGTITGLGLIEHEVFAVAGSNAQG